MGCNRQGFNVNPYGGAGTHVSARIGIIVKEMAIHSFCLASCPRVTLSLPSRTQTSCSAAVTGS